MKTLDPFYSLDKIPQSSANQKCVGKWQSNVRSVRRVKIKCNYNLLRMLTLS